MKLRLGAILIAILLLDTEAPAQPKDSGQYAGYITELRGGGALVTNVVSHESERLQPETARYYRLFENQRLRCEASAVVSIQLRFGGTTNFNSGDWTTMPLEPDPLAADLVRRRAVARISESLAPADLPRGCAATMVFEPANGSRIRLGDALSLRWIPPASAERIRLELTCPLTGYAWQTNLDARTGKLVSPELAAQLTAEQRRGANDFELLCQIEGKPAQTVRFGLLDAATAQRLETDLRNAGAAFPHGVEFHLARAAVFTHMRLLNEAVSEFDAALAVPGAESSIGLLERAAEAHAEIGDSAAAGKLEERLKSLRR